MLRLHTICNLIFTVKSWKEMDGHLDAKRSAVQPYLQYRSSMGNCKCFHCKSIRKSCLKMGWIARAPILMFNSSSSFQECSHRPTLTFLHCAQQCCVSPPCEDKVDKYLIFWLLSLTCPDARGWPQQPLRQALSLFDPWHGMYWSLCDRENLRLLKNAVTGQDWKPWGSNCHCCVSIAALVLKKSPLLIEIQVIIVLWKASSRRENHRLPNFGSCFEAMKNRRKKCIKGFSTSASATTAAVRPRLAAHLKHKKTGHLSGGF